MRVFHRLARLHPFVQARLHTVSALADAPSKKKSKKRQHSELDQHIAAGNTMGASTALRKMPLCDVTVNALAAVLHLVERDGNAALLDELLETYVKRNATFWEESICTVLLRHQCTSDAVEDAWRTANAIAAKSGNWKKRNWSPLLVAVCRHNMKPYVLELIMHAQRCNVALDADDVDVLIRFFSSTHEPLSTLHHLLALVAEYLPALKYSSLRALQEWCRLGGASCNDVSVDAVRGTCSGCGTKLHGYPFTLEHKKKILEGIRSAASLSNKRTNDAGRRLRSFEAWTRLVDAYAPLRQADVLLDGANIGYYGLSSWYHIVKAEMVKHCESSFPEHLKRLHVGTEWNKRLPFVDVPVSMELIDEAMSQVKASGRRPVLFLHERHVEPHNLFPKAQEYLDGWKSRNEVITTPSGLNDDVCWLHAAITLCDPTDATSPGRRDVFVLTNDAMRDHHFQLLHQRSFVAWRGGHQMKFRCVREENRTEVRLEEPAAFTQCIQHNARNCVWHLPIECAGSEVSTKSDGDSDQPTIMWVCLR